MLKYEGPVVLVVMDGIGVRDDISGNGVKQAHAETLKMLKDRQYPTVNINASGHWVGVPDGDTGNSEVGHNAMGAGQVISQGPELVQQAIDSGRAFETDVWKEAIKNVLDNNSTLHFMGLWSDASTHANIYHMFEMMKKAQEQGVKRIRVHIILDGRDVAPESAERYVQLFNDFVASIGNPDYKVASGGGRMTTWMDRYENDWGMVERGWNAAVHGRAEFQFENAMDAVLRLREEEKPKNDQYIPTFVITENGEPVGKIQDGDSTIFYNFRADRAVQAAKAFDFDDADFPFFDRGVRPNVYFVGMSDYDLDDDNLPKHVLVQPPELSNTLADLLDANNVPQYAITETVKFGHMTYYFDGNQRLGGDLHTYVEILSDEDTSRFNERPWMKSAEITDALVDAIKSGKYKFLRVNYPNGDMIGHFGQLQPTIMAVEAVDLALKRVLEAVNEMGGVALITADHGNAEELIYEDSGLAKTSHTSNMVPFTIYDNTENAKKYELEKGEYGLANITGTIAMMLGFTPPEKWEKPMIKEVEQE